MLHVSVAGRTGSGPAPRTAEGGDAAGSPYAGGTIADTQARTRTGVSIVAVLHNTTATPAPRPDFRFQAGDTLVVVGTAAGIKALSRLLGT
jgi:TrkA domain protein